MRLNEKAGSIKPPAEPTLSDWHKKEARVVLEELGADPERGLTWAEAERRLAEHGPNLLETSSGPSAWGILLSQFTEAMVLVLLAAAVISYAVGDLKDTIVILAIVALNAALGFSQEYRAERAMEALKKMAAPHVRCLRDGEAAELEASQLVPGDLVLLEAGSAVPADCRLVEAVNLKAEEAALTGESLPVEKKVEAINESKASLGDLRNMVHLGTAVTYGRAKGVVVATGMKTQLGKIAEMLQTVQPEETVLQRRMNQLGKRLALLALALVAVIFLLGILHGFAVSAMLLTAITLAVAAVPEGLPAVITIALALGARRMVQRKALIRRLPAVETLGSVTTICSDKTGTLTENRMTVAVLDVADATFDLRDEAKLPDRQSETLQLLLAAGALCNDSRLERKSDSDRLQLVGDPTETALVKAAQRFSLDKEDLEKALPRVAEAPFSSDRKRMTTVHSVSVQAREKLRLPTGVKAAAFCKGAVESLLSVCTAVYSDGTESPMSEQWAERIRKADGEMASRGQRVLGVAVRWMDSTSEDLTPEQMERDLLFVGLVGIIDPPRPEAKAAVQVARSAGIRLLMITGDHQNTAQSIGRELGFQQPGGSALTGSQLADMSSAELEEAVEKVSIYARVSPEQKLRIVEALQRRGHLVAVTGDGVNDGPALKRADIGIAMGVTGTDVAKEAAAAVLLDDNFATIVAAVEEGRTIYDNIRKFIRYLLSTNLGEIWTMLLGLLAGLPVPLLPLQILWINLVTDGFPALALGVEPSEPEVMKRKPHPTTESVFARGLGRHILWVGLMMGMLSFGVQYFSLQAGSESWQTMVFTTLALSQMAHVLAIRSESRSLFQQGLFSNPWMAAAVASTLLLQAAVVYLPVMQEIFETRALTLAELAVTAGVSSIVFIAVEIEKWLFRGGKLRNSQHPTMPSSQPTPNKWRGPEADS